MYVSFSLNSILTAEFKNDTEVRELVLTDGNSYLSLSVVNLSTKSLDDLDNVCDLLQALREQVVEDLKMRAKKDPMLAKELAARNGKRSRSRRAKRS
jgi:hypothetical protein